MPRYLADTSIWAWAQKLARPHIREKYFADLFESLDRLPLGNKSVERALEVQREMARVSNGNHRRAAVDFLIAATAEAAGPDASSGASIAT